VVGPAYTVRLNERDSSALYYAIQKAPRGSVIVVDRAGDHTFACVGEFFCGNDESVRNVRNSDRRSCNR